MKVLIYSPVFYPSVGGVEAVAAMVAAGLVELGCSVSVVTTTPGRGDDGQYPYKVIREPSPLALLGLVRWCDVFFQQNVSLKGIWPLIFFRRRFLITHHGLYARSDGTRGWGARLKRFVARFAENIAVSQFVAQELGVECAVIANPYREDIFRLLSGIDRDMELIFVGRLVSEKGTAVLIDALALLKQNGLVPRLTIVGAGPEEVALRRQVEVVGCSGQVTFTGSKLAWELVQLLNRHRLLIIPSLVREGFGIVALEGIACGCAVVASDIGGLPEAVGSCGELFPSGNAASLAECIDKLLSDKTAISIMQKAASTHLASHSRKQVAIAYLAVLNKSNGYKR